MLGLLMAAAITATLPPAPDQQVTEGPTIQSLAAGLKDPDSARYTFGPWKEASCYGRYFGQKDRWHGWAQNVTIVAKNSFGGYATESWTLLYHGGQIYIHAGPDFAGRSRCRWGP